MKNLLTWSAPLLLMLVTLLIGCQQDEPQASAITIACDSSEGTVTAIEVPTDVVERTVKINVYTPSCYDSSGCDYPILYMLHGGGGSQNSWAYNGTMDSVNELIASGELAPLIIVMPNSYDFAEQFEQVLIDATLPYIGANYRVQADRDARAIAGASVGAGLALNMGLKHPSLFGTLGILSYGSVGDLPQNLAARLDALPENPAIYLRIGSEDGFLQNHVELHDLLTARAIEHIYLIDEGGVHTGPSIQSAVPDMLRWVGEQFTVSEGC